MNNKKKWSRKVKPRRESSGAFCPGAVFKLEWSKPCLVLFWESGAGKCQGLVDAISPGSYRTLLCLGLVPNSLF